MGSLSYRSKNKVEFALKLSSQLRLDTPEDLSAALQNVHHPLTKKLINEKMMQVANYEAGCFMIDLELVVEEIILLREKKQAETEKAIRDGVAAEEINEMRQRDRDLQLQQQMLEKLLAECPETMEELLKGVEGARAWITAEESNIKKVTNELKRINISLVQHNQDWVQVQDQNKKEKIDHLIKLVPTVKLVVDGSEKIIDVKAKREKMEEAYIIPPPEKMMLINPALQAHVLENIGSEEKGTNKTLDKDITRDPTAYFSVVRSLRLLNALCSTQNKADTSAESHDPNAIDKSNETCDYRAMLECIRQQKQNPTLQEAFNCSFSNKELEDVKEVAKLLKERKEKESVLDILKKNKSKAENKLHYWQCKIERLIQESDMLDDANKPKMGGG